jgi:hypothetical protein
MNNPMPAAGGSNGEPLESAQARFARALLSRDRIVTATDLECAVRGFDERIVGVSSRSGLELARGGMIRVERVTLSLDAARFQDPEEESRVLRDELEQWLRRRAQYGLQILVDCEWTEGARA